MTFYDAHPLAVHPLPVTPKKGGFGGCSPGTITGTRVRSRVPRNENRNEGTFAKTTLVRNRPFVNPCPPQLRGKWHCMFLLTCRMAKKYRMAQPLGRKQTVSGNQNIFLSGMETRTVRIGCCQRTTARKAAAISTRKCSCQMLANPCPTLGQLLASRILYALLVGRKQSEIARARFCTQSCSQVGQLLVNSSPTSHPVGSFRGLPCNSPVATPDRTALRNRNRHRASLLHCPEVREKSFLVGTARLKVGTANRSVHELQMTTSTLETGEWESKSGQSNRCKLKAICAV